MSGRPIKFCMLAYEGDIHKAVKTLQYWRHATLSIIVVPIGVDIMIESLINDEISKGHEFSPYKIVTHNIGLKNGEVWFGKLKWFQMCVLQNNMNPGDVGIMSDADLIIPEVKILRPKQLDRWNREVISRSKRAQKLFGKNFSELVEEEKKKFWLDSGLLKSSRYKTSLSPKVCAYRVRLLFDKMLEYGYWYGTFSATSQSHGKGTFARGGKCQVKNNNPVYVGTILFSGLLVCQKDSPNVFNKYTTTYCDAEAGAQIVLNRKRLDVLLDPCTVLPMKINRKAYMSGGKNGIGRKEKTVELSTLPKWSILGLQILVINDKYNQMSYANQRVGDESLSILVANRTLIRIFTDNEKMWRCK